MIDASQPEGGSRGKSAEEKAQVLIRRAKRNQRKAWAEGYLKGICTMLRPGDLAVDCGANMGVVTAVLAATGADVIAFEPDPFAFGHLTTTFADRPNVTLINAAVGVGAGSVRLMRANNFADNPQGASVKSTILDGGRRIDADNSVEVPLVDFPGLCANRSPAGARLPLSKWTSRGQSWISSRRWTGRGFSPTSGVWWPRRMNASSRICATVTAS
jgi:FkbM family methyltransferase